MQIGQYEKSKRVGEYTASCALDRMRSFDLDALTAARHLSAVHDYLCRYEEGYSYSLLLSRIGLSEQELNQIEERIERGLWLLQLQKHREVLITVPPALPCWDDKSDRRMIGEIKEITREGIQFNWLAECTDPILGPIGEQSKFRRVDTTSISFNLIDASPGSCGMGQLGYMLPNGRFLFLHESYACFIPPDNVEGLNPDERERMATRYAAYRQPRE